jgi:ribonuclease HI
LKAYTDGARRKNIAACSYVIYDDMGRVIESEAGVFLHGTNNELEYLALIQILNWASKHQVKNIHIYSDSLLVVEQVNGSWQVNNQRLKELRTQAYGLLVRGGHTLSHVKGHAGSKGNNEADRLCNEVMDKWETENGRG